MRSIPVIFFLFLSALVYSQSETKKEQQDPSFFRLCDSIAAAELADYDKQSGRQTGVPIGVQHMDKNYFHRKPMKCMVYIFSQEKFYGKGWKSQPFAGQNKFPYFFSITLNTETREINFVDHK